MLSRLMSESKLLAEQGIPSVFSLVSILENPQDIHTLIRGPPSHLRLDIQYHSYQGSTLTPQIGYLSTPLLGVYSHTFDWIFIHILIRGPPSHIRDIYSKHLLGAHPYTLGQIFIHFIIRGPPSSIRDIYLHH